ncbi:hypothetical protein GOODEAATRI_001275 [Goodea atripinnis]|uniref:Uncharacterized protein n=1 Tax=Goodea atripinnis TaxID=208336 RepID=A0ABV0PJU7_9TELE
MHQTDIADVQSVHACQVFQLQHFLFLILCFHKVVLGISFSSKTENLNLFEHLTFVLTTAAFSICKRARISVCPSRCPCHTGPSAAGLDAGWTARVKVSPPHHLTNGAVKATTGPLAESAGSSFVHTQIN